MKWIESYLPKFDLAISFLQRFYSSDMMVKRKGWARGMNREEG